MQKCAKLRRAGEELAVPLSGKSSAYSISGSEGMKEMSACSACAGNYEDPERTAWREGDDDEVGEGALQSSNEEFPAGE